MDPGNEASPDPTPRPSVWRRLSAAPATLFFFGICIVVFVLAERTGSTETTETLIRFGATWRPAVWQGQWWRLFSSMFLHVGLMHLVWNLWAGFSWCEPFERAVGSVRFAVVYLLSGAAGSAASVAGHDAVSAGASGALFGVMGGVLLVQRLMRGSWKAIWKDQAQRTMLVTIGIWLAIGPYFRFDSFAHLGGLLAGAAFTWALVPKPSPARLIAVLVGWCALVAVSLNPALALR